MVPLAAKPVGTGGGVPPAVVVTVIGADCAESPLWLLARTVNWYGVAGWSPVMLSEVVVTSGVSAVPPSKTVYEVAPADAFHFSVQPLAVIALAARPVVLHESLSIRTVASCSKPGRAVYLPFH